MRLRSPVQPLVFCFLGATPLCAAVAALYGSVPGVGASLCLYGGRYYLAVRASLGQRPQVRRAAAPFARELGPCPFARELGPCPVLYAYFEEHGLRLSGDAVGELGGALHHRRK